MSEVPLYSTGDLAHEKMQPPPKDPTVQGYLAHKKCPLRRTLHWLYAYGPLVILGVGGLRMSEVPLEAYAQDPLVILGGVRFVMSQVPLYCTGIPRS